MIMPMTRTEIFNKSLEAQQNLVAGYDTPAQLTLIEDLLFQEAPQTTVLRDMVLASLTSGGIKPKILESLKRDFLQVYGYNHLPLLIALEHLGLLVKQPTNIPHPFPALRKALRLVVDDTDDTAPNDISYVYSGYAPLSIRLVQCITQKNSVLTGAVPDADGKDGARKEVPKAHPIVGWRGFEDVLGSIPGATVDVRQKDEQKRPHGGYCFRYQRRELIKAHGTTTTVVFFLGGCTYTEIAALRWMAEQTKGRRFLIATTGIITGSSVRTMLTLLE